MQSQETVEKRSGRKDDTVIWLDGWMDG